MGIQQTTTDNWVVIMLKLGVVMLNLINSNTSKLVEKETPHYMRTVHPTLTYGSLVWSTATEKRYVMHRDGKKIKLTESSLHSALKNYRTLKFDTFSSHNFLNY